VSTADIFLWVVIPHVAIAIFVLGHVWRYRHDQFGWPCAPGSCSSAGC